MIQIHCAPLQGYTDYVYRRLHAQMYGGVDTYYTPFIRWEKGDVRRKDIVDILPEHNKEIHLIPQIICGTSDDFNRLCDIIEAHGYHEIDLNMGCPAPMQTKLKRGSGILPHPEAVESLCQEMRRRTEVRFSVKMRLGMDDNEQWQHVLPILNEAPLQHLTLHPRIGTQMYKGEVDMEAFLQFAELCTVPLIFNGDIRTLDEIQTMETTYPSLRGIMLGRGLLARPTLAAEYKAGQEWDEDRRRQILLNMHEEVLAFCTEKYKADSQILLHIHAFWEYQEEFLGRKVWKKIMKAGSMRNYLAAVKSVQM